MSDRESWSFRAIVLGLTAVLVLSCAGCGQRWEPILPPKEGESRPKFFRRVLEHPSRTPIGRAWAAVGLMQGIGSRQRGREVLQKMSESPDPGIRCAVANVVGQPGVDFNDLAPRLLNDPDGHVRVSAARAIADSSQPSATVLLQARLAVEEHRGWLVGLLCKSLWARKAKIDESVLLRNLDLESGMRSVSGVWLFLLGNKEGKPVLEEMLRSPDKHVRLNAIAMLIQGGDRSLLEEALEAARGDSQYRELGLLALKGCLDDERALKAVLAALNDRSKGIRYKAAQVLLESRTDAAYSALRQFLASNVEEPWIGHILDPAPLERLQLSKDLLTELYTKGGTLSAVIAAAELERLEFQWRNSNFMETSPNPRCPSMKPGRSRQIR